MAYFPYGGYQPNYYGQPMPDQLAQLRQNQTQSQMMQPQMQTQIQPQTPQMQTQQADTSGIIWVQGEAGAKAYLVAPGNTVQLWDSESQVIYLKSADMSGMPSMRILDYTERNAAQPAKQPTTQVDFTQFITREELETILTERLKKPTKPTKAKEETENG